MAEHRILIVDDDRDLRTALNARLRAAGYDTCFAHDGVSATAAIKNEKPDLIILDIGLPAGDGFVVLERLKDFPDCATTPVIVLSARNPQENERRALDGGAFAFLQKPADDQVLLDMIQQALSGTD